MHKLITPIIVMTAFHGLSGQSIFSGISSNFPVDSKAPQVSVMSPNGGEIHFYADSLWVKWSATDDNFSSGPVDIYFSTDNGSNYSLLESNIANADSALILPPALMSGIARVKVSATDQFGLTADDESNAAFILQGYFVDIKAFLEGSFSGTDMSTNLNSFNYLPLSQPYTSLPWNYSGTETVTSIPNPDVVDWVLLELRDAGSASGANPATTKALKAGFIMKNGFVKAQDGSSLMQFGHEIDQNLYALLWHRNHLGVMSANPLTLSGNTYSYNFTDAAAKAYGSSLAHKELAAGTWGMIAGDGDSNGQVNNADKANVWKPQTGSSGYKSGDFSMNGQVDNDDKTKWKPNVGKSTQIP